MELNVTIDTLDQSLGFMELQKMYFIHNAIETGWSVKKRNDKYIFAKKHENKKEVYLETYLQTFIEANLKPTKNTN